MRFYQHKHKGGREPHRPKWSKRRSGGWTRLGDVTAGLLKELIVAERAVDECFDPEASAEIDRLIAELEAQQDRVN
jgi:hypothetical protein